MEDEKHTIYIDADDFDPEKVKQALEKLREQRKAVTYADIVAKRQRIKDAQHAYLDRFRILTAPSGLAYKVGNWIGVPLMAFTLFTGWSDLGRIGLFLFLTGLTLQIALLAAVIPGLLRVTREADGQDSA